MDAGLSYLTFERVSIHGSTLASLFQSVISAGRNLDGLLLGHVHSQTHQSFEDGDSGIVTVEEHAAFISAVICSAATCSFYNAAGEVNDAALNALLPSKDLVDEPMIGWLSYRVGAPLQPSMREAAVSSGLATRAAMHAVSQQQRYGGRLRLAPVILLVVSSNQADHGGATLTIDYKAFQVSFSSHAQLQQCAAGQPTSYVPVRLQPLQLSVENLARHQRRETYSSFVSHMRPPAGPSSQEEALALAPAAEQAGRQVTALESNCDAMLRHLKAQCQKVSEGASASAALQAENRRLFEELELLESETG